VSASYDKTVKIWDVVTAQEVLTLRGHAREVLCLAFSPDGRRLASAGRDATVQIWSAAPAEKLRPESLPDRLHREVVRWIRTHVRYEPDDPYFLKVLEQIGKDVREKRNLSLSVGAGLMKSGTAHQITAFAGELFVFELSAARAKALGLNRTGAQYSIAGSSRIDQRASPAVMKLGAPRFDGGELLDGKKDITGQIPCRPLRPGSKAYALRLSFRLNSAWTHKFHHLKELPGKEGPLTFSFSGFNSDPKDKPYSGPVAVFVDLCTVTEKAGQIDIKIYSNSVAQMVDVAAPKGKK
jgi:hypothetical protein